MRRAPLIDAWRLLTEALRRYLADGARLAECRFKGGHKRGTWRASAMGPHQHTWCARCGWCEEAQSFSEEREWDREVVLP